MRFNTKPAMKLMLLGASCAALAACATKPLPPPAPTPSTPNYAPPAPTPAPRPGPVTSQVTPGSEQDFVINVGDRVYFDTDQYQIRSDAQPVLAAQSAWLNRYSSVQIRIEGNCDERGTREYNLALGSRRANSIRDFLVGRGVSPGRITTISYGKERPIDPGEGEGAWQRNRNGHTAITAGAR